MILTPYSIPIQAVDSLLDPQHHLGVLSPMSPEAFN